MKIRLIPTGNFMLDGGAMFGVVPKSIWQKKYPADENNMCNLSMTLMLVEEDDRKILIDTGIGRKQDEKFFGYYFLNGDETLESSLARYGMDKENITDVILTHLHFDHCGGAAEYDSEKKIFHTTFPNAVYWCSNGQWEWAMKPNPREKASYLAENIMPIKESGQLRFFDNNFNFSKNIKIRLYNGHTNALAVPYINYGNRTVVFVADLLPTSAHVPLAWVCGYDTRPLLSFEEKNSFLNEAVENNYILFFEHDLYTPCCTLQHTDKGVRIKDTGNHPDELL
ncbi:MAG: MBL fold metallo-hydrolase [Bacteroidales bacterium]|nr:MBL fold metallo-hydrolase [Bacteroidales bacterium]